MTAVRLYCGRVPKRLFRDTGFVLVVYLKAAIRDYKATWGRDSGLKVPKNPLLSPSGDYLLQAHFEGGGGGLIETVDFFEGWRGLILLRKDDSISSP